MNVRSYQRIHLANKAYKGGIDGDVGPKMKASILGVISRNRDKFTDRAISNPERQLVATSQLILNAMGFPAGVPDGLYGPTTQEAIDLFDYKMITGKKFVLDREKGAEETPTPNISLKGIPRQSDVTKVYGVPGADIESKLVRVKLPFSLRLAWATDKTVSSVKLHKLVAQSYADALAEVENAYGLEEVRRLGIDLWGGGYVNRNMRGSGRKSMHAYGIANDHHPTKNGLKWGADRALFATPPYDKFLEIMAKHKWLNAGKHLWGKDWMHFQVARIK